MTMKEYKFPSKGHLEDVTIKAINGELVGTEGKWICLTVGLAKKPRGNKQNRYYWGVVVKLVTQMFRKHGNYVDENDVHEFLKLRVGKLAQNVVMPTGEVIKSLGSSAKLSTVEFSDYCERIRAWAAQYGCNIPLPDESDYA